MTTKPWTAYLSHIRPSATLYHLLHISLSLEYPHCQDNKEWNVLRELLKMEKKEKSVENSTLRGRFKCFFFHTSNIYFQIFLTPTCFNGRWQGLRDRQSLSQGGGWRGTFVAFMVRIWYWIISTNLKSNMKINKIEFQPGKIFTKNFFHHSINLSLVCVRFTSPYTALNISNGIYCLNAVQFWSRRLDV